MNLAVVEESVDTFGKSGREVCCLPFFFWTSCFCAERRRVLGECSAPGARVLLWKEGVEKLETA